MVLDILFLKTPNFIELAGLTILENLDRIVTNKNHYDF